MLEETVRLDAGTILRRMRAVLRANAGPTLTAFILLVAANVAVDQFSNGSGTNMAANIAGFVASYYVQRAGLERLGLRSPGAPARFGAMFGLNFLSGLGILLGFVAVVIPGVFLTVRWWVADPIVLAEPISVDDAMRRSWDLTRRHFWPILAALATITAPFVIFAALGFRLIGGTALLGDLVFNAAIFGWSAVAWTSEVAIYSLLKSPANELRDVFA